ncbi:MAG: amidohydrolase family protein, partial [Chloroflexota bacterium]|nr:amidohydrolase family protein [Chloroflexota bacterium]
MPDLAVRGGRVVTSAGVVDADVLVQGGRITGIVTRDSGDAKQEIDARGLVVLPGVVDAHVHVNEPGRAEWEGWLAATRGAAAGGVTTIADMPLNSIPPTIDGDAFDQKYDVAAENAVVDFALWGGLIDGGVERLRELAACGVVGVKAFLCPSGVDEFPHISEPLLVPVLAAATAAGLLVAENCVLYYLIAFT